MIEFKNVSLYYGKNRILKEVSFRCEKGKITAIIGKNGAGKTSCLKCLMGEKRFSGEILLEGKDIKALSKIQRAQRISYLSQTLPDTSFTVQELTALGRRPYQKGVRKLSSEDEEIIRSAMKDAGVISFSERSVNTLSGGEKQRAYLSMVLAQETDVIALDEASTYMDAAVENEMYDIIQSLSRNYGKTIILVTHNLTRMVNDADEIVVLNEGEVRAQMSSDQARKTSLIEDMFGVKKYVIEGETIVYL